MKANDIEQIVDELRSELSGHFAGRVYQLSPLSLAIDFGARGAGYLFMSVEPAQPRIYLIRRRSRELEQQSMPPLLFAQAFRAKVGNGELIAVQKDNTERVVRLKFAGNDDVGESTEITLVAQLTGRSANLFLLDEDDHVLHALRPPKGSGQSIGERYLPPPPSGAIEKESQIPSQSEFPTLSEALDNHYSKLDEQEAFARRMKTVRDRVKKELAQKRKLQQNLKRDMVEHGDAEQHKHLGDLLLANISTAVRSGRQVTLKDYFAVGEPEIVLEVDENSSLQDEAKRYFGRYSKAKRAAAEIRTRLINLETEIKSLEEKARRIEDVAASANQTELTQFEEDTDKQGLKARPRKSAETLPGIRRYLSSDEFEVLVGRAAQTNDRLTFKVARPHDLWLHAADYPGSHVVIRNPGRGEIPHRTIIEAAQLAAKFSQAGDDSKVTVHYTPRKFLSKPKGAAPGLVRMSTFKTLTVKPAEAIPRL